MQANASVLDLASSTLYQGYPWRVSADLGFELDITREADLSAHQTFCEAECRRALPDAAYYAQMAYNEAFQTLRQTRNWFFQALICNQMAANARKVAESLRHIETALQILQEELSRQQDELLEARCPQQEARQRLDPLLHLLEIVKFNKAELQLLEQSHNLQQQRRIVEKFFHQGNYQQVLNISEECLQEAARTFCVSHWWCGVFMLCQAYALNKQGVVAEAICAMNKAELLLSDWGEPEQPNDFLRRERRHLEQLRLALGNLSC